MNCKRYLMLVPLFTLSLLVMAQGGTNSPYSMYGLGILADQSQGFNRGMSGVAQGFNDGNQVNSLNPASYSNVDSISFIFDIGMSLLNTSLKEGGTTRNVKSANFEYAVAAFRLTRNLGCSFGILPYSNIGYNFYQTGKLTNPVEDTYTTTYYGSGGLRNVYLGLGFRPFKYFSLGFNAAYLWGTYSRSITNTHSVTSSDNLYRVYQGTVNTYKIDVGTQIYLPINKKNQLTIGATYTIGHNMNNRAEMMDIKEDTTKYSVDDAFSVPTTISAGLAWKYKNKFKVGFDYTLYKFGKLDFPASGDTGSKFVYEMKSGLLKDRTRIAVGGEWTPDEYSRNFFSRVHYRVGAQYTTPYVKITDYTGKLIDGPKEYGLSFGFGIPIMNAYNNRSILNISGQWVKSSLKNYIDETYWRINIGITFNERWFAQWKFE